MPGKKWPKLDEIIVLYQASRGTNHARCIQILKDSRGRDRTITAIRCKLLQLREDNPLLYDSQTKLWNTQEVDRWIALQSLSEDELEVRRAECAI